ncbi:hypothetical protein [Bradyrhizobium sp. I1.7.5]|uniref:IS1096 element passenger TnpR family protein n=1 Tax=Bradyrhizobium sp. I1.7.5 TaxID=3156363 RepID=UPI0033952993
MSLNTTAVRIKVTLKDVKPEVIRRLVVPLTLRLDRLHLTLQASGGIRLDEQSPLRVLCW